MNTVKLEVTEEQAVELEKLGYEVNVVYLATIPKHRTIRKSSGKSVSHCSPKAFLELRAKPKNLSAGDEAFYTIVAIKIHERKKPDEKFPKVRRSVLLSWMEKEFPDRKRASLSSNISRLLKAGALVEVK